MNIHSILLIFKRRKHTFFVAKAQPAFVYCNIVMRDYRQNRLLRL
jgi:hypothetical protein